MPAPARRAALVPAGDDTASRVDPVTDAAVSEADEESATEYVDGTEREHRHLSKAERKRLRKLARMNQAVA